MKKFFKKYAIFSLVILAFYTLFFNYIIAYSSLTSTKPAYGTLSTNVNFRNTASTDSGIIRTLKKGTIVKKIGTIDDFYIIQLKSNEIGVVAKDYVSNSSSSFKDAYEYTSIDPTTYYTIDNVNLRSGPNTSSEKVATLKKETVVKVIGELNGWYTVVTNKGQIGCIRKDLLKKGISASSTELTDNEKLILKLINDARKKADVPALSIDNTLEKIARLKARDMVENDYFSHNSEKYGSPFKMMQNYGINYKTAGENIAGNPDLEEAVKSWLKSETHKQNILSNSYNYIGIGIEESNTYGYIIDVMFIR